MQYKSNNGISHLHFYMKQFIEFSAKNIEGTLYFDFSQRAFPHFKISI